MKGLHVNMLSLVIVATLAMACGGTEEEPPTAPPCEEAAIGCDGPLWLECQGGAWMPIEDCRERLADPNAVCVVAGGKLWCGWRATTGALIVRMP